jgi:hypothetical protein
MTRSALQTPADDAENNLFCELLHTSCRQNDLLDLEEHMRKAARLSRALWEALDNPELSEDPRRRLALQELASEVADHASAAEVIFLRERRARQVKLETEL